MNTIYYLSHAWMTSGFIPQLGQGEADSAVEAMSLKDAVHQDLRELATVHRGFALGFAGDEFNVRVPWVIAFFEFDQFLGLVYKKLTQCIVSKWTIDCLC